MQSVKRLPSQPRILSIELWLSAYHKPFTLMMCDTDVEVGNRYFDVFTTVDAVI